MSDEEYYDDDEPKGEIGGIDAWTYLHPERQLTLGECETLRERGQNVSREIHFFTF